ncbi:substrate-binding domain-containing protein [Tundrisphaera sp. TA3]|uniref:XylR family transcriptional regulator n=1 Tax=Tundrisphaera sp. TA3 TaxID=3435775 RepID=UPI003EB738A8
MKRRERSGPPHVALIVETSMAYGREILHGVAQYIRGHGPWTVYFEQRSLLDPAPSWFRDWEGDGIIYGSSFRGSRLAHASGIPTVSLDDQRTGPKSALIRSDHEAIGSLGAEHFLDRGYTRFAFFGYPNLDWSRRCYEGFSAKVRSQGYACDQYGGSQPVSWGHHLPSWDLELDGVSRWIAGQAKPLGLMACNDFRGVQALDACRRAGVAVPEEVAVIGVDNEVLACELASPPLSSVIPDCRRIGHEAARVLDGLMNGEEAPAETRLIPPVGIVTRQSSDATAIADPAVALAMRFIREHARDGIRVEDVLERVAVSRSILQRRFRAVLGRTIHDAIAAERLRRVKELLVETDLPLNLVADRAGFSHPEYLSAVFRKATGFTLAAYRRRYASPR